MKKIENIAQKKDAFFSSIRKKFDQHPTAKFLSVFGLITVYFLFVSKSHGMKDGFTISLLTWSFFVLGTPIADAGILFDFPMRIITGIRMVYSEIIVWIIAISTNLLVLNIQPDIYEKTSLLSLFKNILLTPIPYWSIILLSGLGTFLSIYIADDLVDSKKQKYESANLLARHKFIIFAFLIALTIFCYNLLLKKLEMQI